MSNSSQSGGIGVLGALGIIFVTLKLVGVIDWSWWWVTAPFWGGFALFLALLVIIGVPCLFAKALKNARARR